MIVNKGMTKILLPSRIHSILLFMRMPDKFELHEKSAQRSVGNSNRGQIFHHMEISNGLTSNEYLLFLRGISLFSLNRGDFYAVRENLAPANSVNKESLALLTQ
jgi:hypothetical protein